MIEDIQLRIWTEKIEGHGEDAPPLLIAKGNSYAVGVFDGMGGQAQRLARPHLLV